MKRITFVLLLFLFLFACQSPQPPMDETILSENAFFANYPPSDLQKMRWLAGSWKGVEFGKPIRQSFQFHGGNALEILSLYKDGEQETFSFAWHEGRYYYGRYRQWVVTWIGEKAVRLDPIQSGLSPMTWTRLNDKKWHLVRHAPGGDEVTVMENAEEMHP
jgi:hypothetical protein